MDSLPILRFIIAGQLRRDYILTQNGKAHLDGPGGNLLYAASGLGVWSRDAGLIGRASMDYPRSWLETYSRYGFDIHGVHFTDQSIDQRQFIAYPSLDSPSYDNPISHFSRWGLPFPKSLLGYNLSPSQIDSRTQPSLTSLRSNDIPGQYLEANAAHLCPLDFISHTLLPPILREGNVSIITLDPADGYMNPIFWEHLPGILGGINAFLTPEDKLKNLFLGRSSDPWEMSEALGNFGCEIVVIRRGARGQYVYTHANRSRWIVPAYPVQAVDPTGAGSSFCGGFLSGFKDSYDALEGTLHGNISASLSIEGSGPEYVLDSLPGLAQARLDALRSMVRRA